MFTIGNKIKLKSYKEYPDYRDRINEIAIVTDMRRSDPTFDCEIIWKDGYLSLASFNNMILLTKDWDD